MAAPVEACPEPVERVLRPDAGVRHQVARLGAGSLNKCIQCGTCSVTCSLTPEDRPFPRKEMLWAAWGLKDRLLADPDLWLCHGCNDCAARCPRGGKPGETMAALRDYVMLRLTLPEALARFVAAPASLPVLVAFPVLVLLAFLAVTGRLGFPPGEIVFDRFIPIPVIEIVGLALGLVVASLLGIGAWRFWRGMAGYPQAVEQRATGNSLKSSLARTLAGIMLHRDFARCQANRGRRYAHMAILYGSLLLVLATAGRAIYTWTGREGQPPFLDPVKVAGNLGGLLLLAGLAYVLYRRLARNEETGRTGYFDGLFLGALLVTALTGFLTEAARLAEVPGLAYSLYLVHLVSAFSLLAYAPFSRLAHFVYRTLAVAYAQQSGRHIAPQSHF